MTPNDIVRIKPTDAGWASLKETVREVNDNMRRMGMKGPWMTLPVADPHGYITGQFWCLLANMKWGPEMGRYCLFSDLQPVVQAQATPDRSATGIYEKIKKAFRLTTLVLIALASLATPALGMIIYNVHEPLALALVTGWGVAWGRWFVPGLIVTWKVQR